MSPRLSQASRDMGLSAIRASEVPMLLGISPYGGPHALWQRKSEGQTEPEAERLSQRLGHLLEPATRTLAAEREGVRIVANAETRRHRTVPLVATPDGLIVRPSALYEGKTRQWAGDWGDAGDPDGVPPAVRAQVAAQMAVWGKRRALVGVLIGGADPRTYWLERDRELVDAIEEAVVDLWACVERGEPPPVDGSDDAAAWLRRRFRADAGTELVATAEQAILVEDLRDAAGLMFDAEDRFELLRQQVQDVLFRGSAQRLLAPAGVVSWKPTSTTDWQAIAQEIGAIPEDLVAMHTRTDWKAVVETLRPRPALVAAHRRPNGPLRFSHPFTRKTASRSAA